MQTETVEAVNAPQWVEAGDFTLADDPFQLFAAWFEEATRTELNDPNAMTLATIDAEGMPNARMMLLKGVDERGFMFFTHTTSAKGGELTASPRAALVLHWKSLKRQVRARGVVESLGVEEANDYFASRPRQSQIGAWASQQSKPLESRAVFEASIASYAAQFTDVVPRPSHWCGYRVVPAAIEFWQERPFRLHDRIVFKRSAADEPWNKTRLYP